MPYVQWQHIQDAAAPRGHYHYWKTASFATLSDSAIETLAEAVNALPTPITEIHVQHLGGAVARVPDADTPFSNRHAQFFVNLIGRTVWPEEQPAVRGSVRHLHGLLTAEASVGVLPNFTDQDDGALASQFSAPQAARLAALRDRYDPGGLFSPRLKR
jgi:hypothetical protein